MITLITGLPIEIIQELDGDDYLSLLQAAKGFIPARFREMAASGQDLENGPDTQES